MFGNPSYYKPQKIESTGNADQILELAVNVKQFGKTEATNDG